MEYGFYRIGKGKQKALALHGFPDSPLSMIPFAERIASAGFEVVVPYTMGYFPNGGRRKPGRRDFSLVELSEFLEQLIRGLGWKNADLIGHDWGAIQVYALCNYSPQVCKTAVTISVPPLGLFLGNLWKNPLQLQRSWYILFFQFGFDFPKAKLQDKAFLRSLWESWSPGWEIPEKEFQAAAHLLSDPSIAENALGYYRGLFPHWTNWQDWNESRKIAFQKISLPGMVLVGENDRCIHPDLFLGGEDSYSGIYEFHKIPGAGHFVPLEKPDEVFSLTKLFLDKYSLDSK
jgi:pimeloyl-ACP methyl ester carboxylesterase